MFVNNLPHEQMNEIHCPSMKKDRILDIYQTEMKRIGASLKEFSLFRYRNGRNILFLKEAIKEFEAFPKEELNAAEIQGVSEIAFDKVFSKKYHKTYLIGLTNSFGKPISLLIAGQYKGA